MNVLNRFKESVMNIVHIASYTLSGNPSRFIVYCSTVPLILFQGCVLMSLYFNELSWKHSKYISEVEAASIPPQRSSVVSRISLLSLIL